LLLETILYLGRPVLIGLGRHITTTIIYFKRGFYVLGYFEVAMAGSSRHIYGAWQDGGALFIGTSGLAEGGYLGAEWRETGRTGFSGLRIRIRVRQQRWPCGYGTCTGQRGQLAQMWVNTGSTGIQRTGWPRPETRAAYDNAETRQINKCTCLNKGPRITTARPLIAR